MENLEAFVLPEMQIQLELTDPLHRQLNVQGRLRVAKRWIERVRRLDVIAVVRALRLHVIEAKYLVHWITRRIGIASRSPIRPAASRKQDEE